MDHVFCLDPILNLFLGTLSESFSNACWVLSLRFIVLRVGSGVVWVPIDPPTHMTGLFRSIPAMDDRPLEDQAADMDSLSWFSRISEMLPPLPMLAGQLDETMGPSS
ncbi:hypothetical protein U1Q18_041254 [Sarracenia purpurea var. burkii]